MRTAYRSGTGLGQTEPPHLALGDQLPDRPGHIFHGHVWIDPVLIIKVDVVGAQAL
jgi:hypothetical protein